jgi:hypothetical protein
MRKNSIDVSLKAQFKANKQVKRFLSIPQNRVNMTFWQLMLHFFGFVMPALAMAVFMPLAGRWVMGPGGPSLSRRMGLHALSGVLVLAVGLWVQGHDGKMNTYIFLVLTAATLEWVLKKAWKRH